MTRSRHSPRRRRHYPDWVAAYVATFDGRTEAPTRLHKWTAVSTIAGALTRRVWIDEVTFRYYPNFYILFVAPAGVSTKSTAIGLGMSLLKQLDHIYIAPDNTNYPALARDLARHSTELRDVVAEEAADDLWIKQCAVTAAISEFGMFFKVDDDDMVNALTDLWDCRSIHVKDTKHNGTDVIEHPFVNILAGTTPDWARDKLKQVRGWGLASRIIFVYTQSKARSIPRPSKLWKAGEYERLTGRLMEDLRHISELEGPVEFSPAADEAASQWYEGLSAQVEAHNAGEAPDPWIGQFLARKQAHVHKLAMILSVARRDTLVIEAEDFADAAAAVEEVEVEIPAIFALNLEPTPLAIIERTILERVVKELEGVVGAGLPRASIFSRLARFVDSTTANKIIDNAIARGAFVQRVSGKVSFLRLPP